MRIGVPKEYFVEGMDEQVRQAVRAAIDQMAGLGAEVDWEVSLPSTDHALAVYYIIAPSEASANLARYDGVKYGYSYSEGASMWENMEKTREFGFGDEVKRRIMLGTYALSAGYYDAYYLKAQKVRTLIRREFDAAFQDHDVLVMPVSPTTAFRLGEKTDDPLQMYLSDVFTIPVNIAGLPGISIPCGFSRGDNGSRLPIGLQIIAKPFDEPSLFRAAYAYEQASDWHKQHPEL
jgi:aspartyl-tRNA(Asn)/glutamyl-tRNA(Gln) amidotransferase subunit A